MNKYGAKSVEIDGYRFASKAEARRYEELLLLQLAGEIRELEVHPRWALYVLETSACCLRRVGYYTGDFMYEKAPCWTLVVEDVKGGKATRTEAYRLRKRMFEAIYGLPITEVG